MWQPLVWLLGSVILKSTVDEEISVIFGLKHVYGWASDLFAAKLSDEIWRYVKMKKLLLLIIGLLLSTACEGAGDPAPVVERYLRAKVAGDADTVRALLCAAKEADLDAELRTYAIAEGVKIEEMACQREGERDVVQCNGRIVALYGTEENVFPLVSYRVVQEDGEWKYCGEG